MFENAKGFKGFEKGLVCKGKQYAENTVFEENESIVCRSGMHYCVNPFDVLDHYDLVNANGEFNEFADVEALEPPRTDDGKKFCTTKLKVGTKLSFAGFVKTCVNFILEKTAIEASASMISDKGANRSQIGSSGYGAKIGSSGYGAKINSSGASSVLCCAGNNSRAKAGIGSWITLAEWKKDEAKGRMVPVCVKTEFVDGKRIKIDTWYQLKDGVFVECKEDE